MQVDSRNRSAGEVGGPISCCWHEEPINGLNLIAPRRRRGSADPVSEMRIDWNLINALLAVVSRCLLFWISQGLWQEFGEPRSLPVTRCSYTRKATFSGAIRGFQFAAQRVICSKKQGFFDVYHALVIVTDVHFKSPASAVPPRGRDRLARDRGRRCELPPR